MTLQCKQKGLFPCANNSGGYVTLISVIIVCAALLMVALSSGWASLDESKAGLREERSWRAYNLASLCAEDAIMKLKRNLSYAGGETLAFDDGSCYINPIEGSRNANRTIKTEGTVGGLVKKVEIQITVVNPSTSLFSWEQVSDF
ncbi:MAG: hypothetical protein WC926_03380 [Candidatus Paceibacterota bacterium]|jgi:hypothetical protein